MPGNLDILDHKSKGQNDAQLLHQCPSCGWKDIRPDKLGSTAGKAYEQIKPLAIAAPCPEYSDFADKLYEGYKEHQYRTAREIDTIQGKYNIIPCPGFRSGLPSYTRYPADVLTTQTYYPQSTRNYINQAMIPEPIVMSKPKSCKRETQLSTKQLGTVEQHEDKGIQNTVCMSKLETDVERKYYRRGQSKPLTSQEELKQVAVNTTQKGDKTTRNTICANLSNCQAPKKCSSTREAKQMDANTVKCPEVESLEALDGKERLENEVCIRETCFRDTMEIIKQSSAVTQALLRCLETVMQAKVSSITSLLSRRDYVNSNSSGMTVCEQISSKFANENRHFAASSAVELESISCLPCLEKTETLLELMKCIRELNSENVQKSCVRKEDAMHTFVVLSKIKECADEILKICMLVDCSKRQLLNKFYSRFKSKSKCPSKQNSALNLIQAQEEDVVEQSAAFANSKDIEVLYGPSISKVSNHNLSENGTAHVEMMEELFVKDKAVPARTENHDIGLNVSVPQISLREAGTQYTPKQLQDTGIVTDRSFGEKINVATQHHEPMLIRVTKSNNSEGILKLDKETCVRDAHILRWANVDKWSKNMYQKYSVKKYYELSHPVMSHVREKEVNYIDYRTFLLSNGTCRYKKRCRSSLPRDHDWTTANTPKLELSSNQYVSRIPLYARSRKYTRKRTELHRMSQSYNI
ncbi:PREDICTED: uncharacterized protein LOC105557812 [Vollenhovia emeryi]|uniref:uncharacterized protein LOC105557812 n=1 Tax=Vollenhovia emeryi TaxID=411798 RepID=UPI0005F48F0F|nr:PREDICTED: uncharacterized protein LOC105557812 [Vollenhovia emeryi]XP_011860564.1 PREDICTED: uncharacterized protein LOC105557812 [Vollenhovia emeryi]